VRSPAEFDRALEEETSAILEAVESLRRLVDEFSLFARLPRPQPVPCDLRQLVAQALALYAPRIEAAGVEVEVDAAGAPETVAADPEQIGRVLPGGRGEVAEIEVRDNGVGFASDALHKVFEPYYTTRADRGGTGLGLAIAHRIVTEHSGTIHASGAPGHGATITIRLPVEGPRQAS
jgi:nitrogen fixation/metabolism regulation signal transduction histidine kinase